MNLHRLLLRSLRRPLPTPSELRCIGPTRTFAFSSAEEAAAERRRRKRRLRIEPPLHALRRDPAAPRPPRDPNQPPQPQNTSALTGPRLSLHNRCQSLMRSDQLDAGARAAREAVFSSTRPTVFTCNAVIASFYRAGRYDDAAHHFDFFFRRANIIPNVVSYNFLIISHVEAGRVDVAMDVYRHIVDYAPYNPSCVTYQHMTKGLVDAGRVQEALDMLRAMINNAHGADSLVFNNVMRGFIKIGDMPKALELFEELTERCMVYDGIVHATLMETYFEKGEEKKAMESFKMLMAREFKMKNTTSNTLLELLLKYDKMGEALRLFDHMLATNSAPSFSTMDTDSYNLLVNKFFEQGKIAEAVGIFRRTGAKPCAMDVGCYNNIIGKLCAEGGDWIDEAEKLLDEMAGKSVTADTNTYKYLMDGYLMEGRSDDALRCFAKLVDATKVEDGLKVEPDFYKKQVGDLAEKGLLEEAVGILTRMAEGGVVPDTATYELVIVPLCEQRRLEMLRKLMDEMAKNEVPLFPPLYDKILSAFGNEDWKADVERLLRYKVERSSPDAQQSTSQQSNPQLEQVPF